MAIIAKIMEKRTNSKDLFRRMVSDITIAESGGEIESIAYLVMHSLFGVRREQIMAGKEIAYDEKGLEEIITRINSNEPVQYILQEAEFYGRLFFVDRNVLIPRPETELLVREVLDHARGRKSLKVLDVGVGSGCIAVTLACELPDAIVTATDISNGAIEVAHRNSLTFNTYIDFFVNDILNDDLPVTEADIIVSNPPYVALAESSMMSPNVLEHEPHLALFVPDNDRLVFYKAIAKQAAKILNRPGVVFVEINERYGEDVKAIFIENGFEAGIIRDIDRKDRIVKAWVY
ncbi:MAG TPA: peptide chain release factor N(5)-glutamine methyltransferase [Cyclobacteriaceae bacterium]|nr:peptide chain release factor N(5)-glutamine methyltransferase [Cyclobacteriaceae bacterium]